MENLKSYLGDGVYAKFDGYAISLLANDSTNPTDTIVLEPQVMASLNRFVDQCAAIQDAKVSKVAGA